MSTMLSLKAEARDHFGKGPSGRMRDSGLVPATIYGGGKDQVFMSLDAKEIKQQYLKGGFMSSLVKIKVGTKEYRALPKSVQFNPVTDNIAHLDFVFIEAHQQIKVAVPVELLNKEKCIGVKSGGVLNFTHHEIEVHCDADEIPYSIPCDVAELKVGHSIHAGDLVLPKGVELALDVYATIVAVTGVSKEEEVVTGVATESEAVEPAAVATKEGK